MIIYKKNVFYYFVRTVLYQNLFCISMNMKAILQILKYTKFHKQTINKDDTFTQFSGHHCTVYEVYTILMYNHIV